MDSVMYAGVQILRYLVRLMNHQLATAYVSGFSMSGVKDSMKGSYKSTKVVCAASEDSQRIGLF